MLWEVLVNNKTTTWKSHQNIFLCGSAAGADSRETDINARVVKKITMNLPLDDSFWNIIWNYDEKIPFSKKNVDKMLDVSLKNHYNPVKR